MSIIFINKILSNKNICWNIPTLTKDHIKEDLDKENYHSIFSIFVHTILLFGRQYLSVNILMNEFQFDMYV